MNAAMASDNLQLAIDNLKLHDIYVRDQIARFLGDFDPKYAQDLLGLHVQRMHVVRQAQVAELEDGHRLLRVFVRLGVRWIDPDEQDEDAAVRALVEAEFVAEYRMQVALDRTAIDAFSLSNASYHVWPYWRELLSNQCLRMHLPKLVLPMVQFADNGGDSGPERETNG